MNRVGRRAVVVGIGVCLAGCVGDENDADDAPSETRRRGPEVNGRELFHSRPLAFYEPDTGRPIADVHGHEEGASHWHFQPFEVPLDDERVVEAIVREYDETQIPLGPDGELTLSVAEDPGAFVEIEIDAELVTFRGIDVGEGDVRFEVRGDRDDGWVTPALTVEVA